ncbi:hypothetical protein ACFOZ1_07960 [Gracilibacillus marinus]|uniref:Conjugal transfer protein n=1 Tax=Gracilibacillus marinus TaxID=630535 RepID=A0ABV8VY65_9BACI
MTDKQCMYDGKVMTILEYKRKQAVSQFEQRLTQLSKSCASQQHDGTCVITGEQCSVLNDGFPTHQNRRCLYFEQSVLPADNATFKDYFAIMQGDKVQSVTYDGTCRRCQEEFLKKAKNQLYCASCASYLAKERKRKYYHKTAN